MATYLRPGVFIEETLQPLPGDTAEVTASVAAFVGTTSQGGPVGPTLVNSWSSYQALFGNIRSGRDDMAYALYTFFNNGGSSAYVVRAVNADATAASVTLKDTEAAPADTLQVTAKSPGTWASSGTSASRVLISVSPSTGGDRFDLTVQVGDGTTLIAREEFSDLTLDPNDSRYAISILDSPTVGSKYAKFETLSTWAGPTTNPAAVDKVPLTGGSDGTGSPDLVAAAKLLEDIDANIDLALPGVQTNIADVVSWAESRGNVFVVVDAPKTSSSDTPATATTSLTTFAGTLPESSYAGIYAPYLYINDPASSVPGALREVAPSGAVLGQISRTDRARGVQKAPAGTETALRGVISPSFKFNESSLDTLNQAGVNVIRTIPGNGFCIMGARTQDKRTAGRYVNIRRTMMYLRHALVQQTRFAVFEPNDPNLWSLLSAVVTQYLTTQWQIGTLKGNSLSEAFFVKCDEGLNTPDVVNSGNVVLEVGVAIASPAEFVVIRIGQFDGGATVVESTEA